MRIAYLLRVDGSCGSLNRSEVNQQDKSSRCVFSKPKIKKRKHENSQNKIHETYHQSRFPHSSVESRRCWMYQTVPPSSGTAVFHFHGNAHIASDSIERLSRHLVLPILFQPSQHSSGVGSPRRLFSGIEKFR